MNYTDLKEILAWEIVPGYHLKLVHSERMTLAHWDIEPDKEVPLHSHIHEQVVNVISGEYELIVDGEKKTLTEGSVVIIPPNVEHSGKSITKCHIIDAFCPVRDDYKYEK